MPNEHWPSEQHERRPRLLTVDDVAEFLALQPKTIRERVLRREIPFVKVGRSVRFRPEDIDEMIERDTRKALRRRHRTSPRTQVAND